MNQTTFFSIPSWTVADLTRYLREMFISDSLLRDIWVQGEVSNLSQPTSGHIYFTVKDASATLRCVMWRSNVKDQKWIPKEGVAIEVHGYIDIYEAGGQYQLYADCFRSLGEGTLYQEFMQLKEKLEAEGLFDASRKRPIPRWPERIGIVTSPTGAAIQDILDTIQRRYPLTEVILSPAPVQGSDAPEKIASAIKLLATLSNPDVIILTRGGGSIEDLWAFNQEIVARTIVACPIPIITGVGHEVDFTIADFVCDLRAPTPTAAAELATPNQQELLSNLEITNQRLNQLYATKIKSFQNNLSFKTKQLSLKTPLGRIQNDRQKIDEYLHRCNLSLHHFSKLHQTHIHSLTNRLESLNPIAILSRGYAIVLHSDGEIVRSVSSISSGEKLNIQVQDGRFSAIVQ